MVFAVGAHAPLSIARAGISLSSGVLVAAAGVVVVLAILLVFVMVLRSNGAARRTANGLGYDAQQGPLGQPQGPMNQMNVGGRNHGGGYGADDGYGANNGYGANDAYGASDGYGGYNDPYAAPAGPRSGGPAQGRGASQDAWGAGPSGAMGGGMAGGQAAGWGAGANGMNGMNGMNGPNANDDQWGANDGWGRQPAAAPSRPMGAPAGMNGQVGQMGQMPGPGSQPQWDMPSQGPAGARGGGWGAPGAQGGINPGAPGWDQPDQNAGWGAPAAAPASANAGWGAAAPVGAPPSMPGYGTPNAPSYGGAGGAGGYGELDKTRVVRPAGGAQRLGVLVVRQGKEPGRVFELRKDRITIGRSRESDIFLEDLAVSRLHTTVSMDGAGRFIVRDENSANGTFVNGQRISEYALEEGDEVQVGQTVLAFQRR